MPQTHLIFDAALDRPPTAQITLTGQVAVSPLVELNEQTYLLTASYTHADGTTENLYTPLFKNYGHYQ